MEAIGWVTILNVTFLGFGLWVEAPPGCSGSINFVWYRWKKKLKWHTSSSLILPGWLASSPSARKIFHPLTANIHDWHRVRFIGELPLAEGCCRRINANINGFISIKLSNDWPQSCPQIVRFSPVFFPSKSWPDMVLIARKILDLDVKKKKLYEVTS